MIKLSTSDLAAYGDGGPSMQMLAESAHARVLLIGLNPGQRLKDHATPCQVQIHVLDGACTVVEAGRSLEAGAGDLVIVPAGSRHRVEASGRTLLLVTLTPHPASASFPVEQRDRIVSRAPHTAA